MSFSSLVKDELSIKENEFEKDLLSALFKAAASITISDGKWQIDFKSENVKIAKMVFSSISSIYSIKPDMAVYKTMKLDKKNVYYLSINEKVDYILKDLSLMTNSDIKSIMKNNKRIASFLKGAFLGVGSVNDPHTTNYHLEMAFAYEDFADSINQLLNHLSFSSKIIERRNQYVVYIKRAQEIADFLAFIGATNCYLQFEDIRMERDFYNSDNRINNCDIANYVRTNKASLTQIEDIDILDKYIGINNLDSDIKLLSNLRKNNVEDSLRELATKYSETTGKEITKSGINHLFLKIKALASEYRKNEK